MLEDSTRFQSDYFQDLFLGHFRPDYVLLINLLLRQFALQPNLLFLNLVEFIDKLFVGAFLDVVQLLLKLLLLVSVLGVFPLQFFLVELPLLLLLVIKVFIHRLQPLYLLVLLPQLLLEVPLQLGDNFIQLLDLDVLGVNEFVQLLYVRLSLLNVLLCCNHLPYSDLRVYRVLGFDVLEALPHFQMLGLQLQFELHILVVDFR